MTYQQTLDYLYGQRPSYERQGAGGYKPGLQTSRDLDALYGHPHRQYRSVHIAGTNGKGSVSTMLAAVLQSAGYRVGLFTSPHFVDFRERIRVNGRMIPRQEVVRFVDDFMRRGYAGDPSFFELTSTMAFRYFADCKVDFAMIETGLGGRLDSTNIITPILSVITNISLDHTEFLGDTLPEIAREKAGIIKAGVPVVVGEAQGEVRQVFEQKAKEEGAPIVFSDELNPIAASIHADSCQIVTTRSGATLACALTADYQLANIATVLTAIDQLVAQGVAVPPEAVRAGLAQVCQLTGFMGRWTTLQTHPRVVCDSGHNLAGIKWVTTQLAHERYERLHMVVGFMRDKDLKRILPLLPQEATYYFTQACTPRALPAGELRRMAAACGLQGECYASVNEALAAAQQAARPEADLIFVGGSMYVLAELFSTFQENRHEEEL